jgi:hypothetical protein
VINKEIEKILKYEDPTMEIQRMWNLKTKVMPVIIGATGTISKSFRKYLKNICGQHEIKKSTYKKATILGSAHTLRKVLMPECKTFIKGNNIAGAVNCNYRTAA